MSASKSLTRPLKILCAIDSFKGTLSSEEASEIVSKIASTHNHKTEAIFISDGGEGLLKALEKPLNLTLKASSVLGPDFKPVKAICGYSESSKTLVVEMATASGLPLVPEENRNPLKTTSYGTGELILNNLKTDTKRILLGVGGSATSDGGIGALQALGLNISGLDSIATGDSLTHITDLSAKSLRLKDGLEILVACDVNNPFTGPRGAAKVYGYQKCAERIKDKDTIINKIEEGMLNLQNIIQKNTGIDLSTIAAAGAAGGIAGSLHALAKAKLIPGIDLIFEAIDIQTAMQNADLIITGEGCLDEQTSNGKVVSGILHYAKKLNKPVIGVFGQTKLTSKQIEDLGFLQTYCLINDNDLNTCLNKTKQAMELTIKKLFTETKIVP